VTSYINGHLTRSISCNELVSSPATSRCSFKPIFSCSQSPKEARFSTDERPPLPPPSASPSAGVVRPASQPEVKSTNDACATDNDDRADAGRSGAVCFCNVSSSENNCGRELDTVNGGTSSAESMKTIAGGP